MNGTPKRLFTFQSVFLARTDSMLTQAVYRNDKSLHNKVPYFGPSLDLYEKVDETFIQVNISAKNTLAPISLSHMQLKA